MTEQQLRNHVKFVSVSYICILANVHMTVISCLDIGSFFSDKQSMTRGYVFVNQSTIYEILLSKLHNTDGEEKIE